MELKIIICFTASVFVIIYKHDYNSAKIVVDVKKDDVQCITAAFSNKTNMQIHCQKVTNLKIYWASAK